MTKSVSNDVPSDTGQNLIQYVKQILTSPIPYNSHIF